jgi:hypothetical protein
VQWFYSKEDIKQVKPIGVKDLDRQYPHTQIAHALQLMYFFCIRHLTSAAKQELYASNHNSIVSSEGIASELYSPSVVNI